MTRPKRCPDGQIWAARDRCLEPGGTHALNSLRGFGDLGALVVGTRLPRLKASDLDAGWVNFNLIASRNCLSEFRRTFGLAPRKNQAWLIDTTRREWWCPKCKEWWKRPSWIFNERTEQITDDPYCPDCGDNIKTKSRCIVVRKLKLTKDGVVKVKI